MEPEKITNLEIPGLPDVLTSSNRTPIRTRVTGTYDSNCPGPRQEQGECTAPTKKVYIYNVPHLLAVQDVYAELAKGENAELLPWLPPITGFGAFHIENSMHNYFASRGIEVPDRKKQEAYLNFLKEHKEAAFFEYMGNESEIAGTYTGSEIKPKTESEFISRMKEAMLRQYQIEIGCCPNHLEATIRHAIQGTWRGNVRNRTPSPSELREHIFPDSLVYAPDSQEAIRVRLTTDIAPDIVHKADQLERLFYDIVLKQS